MSKPVLVIMAAGMGSRYGGLKQLDPVGGHGQVILDYSMYDARRAGFETVVFVIKREIEEEFKARVGRRVERHMDVKYVFQAMDDLPKGYAVPEGRAKPWGTAQAALAPSPSTMPTTITAPRRFGPFISICALIRTAPVTPTPWWATG